MSHRPATVVILAWNEWEMTRACLESLRPTLGPRDQVVVVDNGSQDGTAAGLARYPWVEVVTNPENRGFAAGCNQGAALARGEVVVFLNNDTLLPARWLDGLLEPFDDGTVGATGPRSNFVSGAQLLPSDVAYTCARPADVQRFAREWRDAHRRQVTDVTRLVGFCLAVRRDLFSELGGFDEGFGIGGYEDDDLCTRIAARGRRLLITHESFVHHWGHRTFDANEVDWYALQQHNAEIYRAKHAAGAAVRTEQPLVSACLVVKDEEELLPGCLASLAGVADEIVVYDTGSTDATRAIAAAAGARVVEGYWDDDFGRARNAALDHCTGTWILHVDADEQVAADATALRAELAAAADGLLVDIDNLDGDGERVLDSHQAIRLFRRDRGRWQGRLHEQVVTRDGGELARSGCAALRIRHSGYARAVMDARGKTERNLRMAQAAVESGQGDRALALVNLARTLAADAQYEQAISTFAQARPLCPAGSPILRLLQRELARTMLRCGRSAEALILAETMAAERPGSAIARYLAGQAHLELGDAPAAYECLSGLTEVAEDGYRVADREVQVARGLAAVRTDHWDEAARDLVAGVCAAPDTSPVWAAAAESAHRAGTGMAMLAAAVPADAPVEVLGAVLTATPDATDDFAEQLWRQRPGQPAVLAAMATVAPALPVERALEWSARLREYGLAEQCPLVRMAGDRRVPALRRLQALCVAQGGYGDERARGELPVAVMQLTDDELELGLGVVDQLCPALLPEFVTVGAGSPGRALRLAQLLHRWGAAEEAMTVFDHGWSAAVTDRTLAGAAAGWLTEVGESGRAQRVRQALAPTG